MHMYRATLHADSQAFVYVAESRVLANWRDFQAAAFAAQAVWAFKLLMLFKPTMICAGHRAG